MFYLFDPKKGEKSILESRSMYVFMSLGAAGMWVQICDDENISLEEGQQLQP